MLILGNLFSNNPTILYTIGDEKKEKKNKNTSNNIYKSNNNVLIEDTEHLKKFFGMR